ncbi:MAG: alpha-amylase family glycosyl hydrolase [Oscillospiraceae bacterium]|nr:alpha-amylase family glycosyl hydrolase [Oscillospiraceae bacterium]
MKKMIKSAVSLLLAAALFLGITACAARPEVGEELPIQTQPKAEPVLDPVDDNYRTFYQVFVGSFSDSNNDGIGDLRGVINRMDYLNDGDINSGSDLGVQGIWLSPIFTSPSYHKYDAKDYYEIDWRFGTMEDLKELADLCEQRNVKLILDLAINHTSSQNEWFLQFKEARANGDTENPYYDFYSCSTTADKLNGVTYQKIAGVDCWYECNFSGDMPELNYDNPEVREAVLDVAKYYLDLGVDGFRFDAVKYIYYGDVQRSVAFWEWYMEELRKLEPEIYCVGECWSGEGEILEYYSAMNCFNFAMSQAEGVIASTAKGQSMSNYTNYIASYQKKVWEKNPEGMVMPFLSNHDMDRIAGAFVVENFMRMAANLYLLSPGSPVIYYGEEIGMRGSRGGEMTDANRRLAMLWGDGDLIRDPEGTTYQKKNQITTTVADQMADENSLYSYYCDVIAVRHRYPAIARGTYTVLKGNSRNLGGFQIDYQGDTLCLLHNNGQQELTFDFSKVEGFTPEMLCDFVGMGSAKLEGNILTLGPQTSAIVK